MKKVGLSRYETAGSLNNQFLGNDKDLYPKFSSPLSHLNQIGQSEKDFIKIKMLTMFVCVHFDFAFLIFCLGHFLWK